MSSNIVRTKCWFSNNTFVKSYDRFLVIIFIVILHVFSLTLSRHFGKLIRSRTSKPVLQASCLEWCDRCSTIREEEPVRLRLPTSALFVARFCVEFYRKKYQKTVKNNTDFNGLSDLGFVCLRLARRRWCSHHASRREQVSSYILHELTK